MLPPNKMMEHKVLFLPFTFTGYDELEPGAFE
jgi:hypothetical protein